MFYRLMFLRNSACSFRGIGNRCAQFGSMLHRRKCIGVPTQAIGDYLRVTTYNYCGDRQEVQFEPVGVHGTRAPNRSSFEQNSRNMSTFRAKSCPYP